MTASNSTAVPPATLATLAAAADAEEVLWDEICNALPSGSALHESAFAQLQCSEHPYKSAIAVAAALPQELRQRSRRTLRTWAAREVARETDRQRMVAEQVTAASQQEKKAQREHELTLLRLAPARKRNMSNDDNDSDEDSATRKRSKHRAEAVNTSAAATSATTGVPYGNPAREMEYQRQLASIGGVVGSSRTAAEAQAAIDKRNSTIGLLMATLKTTNNAARVKCKHASGCERNAEGKTKGMCSRHGGLRRCVYRCEKEGKQHGLCKGHGGGKKCGFAGGCTKNAERLGMCGAHGGGRKCKIEGCSKNANRRKLCIAHGGGQKCKFEGCEANTQQKGLCTAHGGRKKRCSYAGEGGCDKGVQLFGLCTAHGGKRATRQV